MSALWNRTGQGLFPELARSVGTAGRPSSAQCPGPGALLGARQAAPGHSGVGQAPGQLRPGSVTAPAGSRVAGRTEGHGRCRAGSARELLKGHPFDVCYLS